MHDLLLPAYQKLYAALNSLERFSKGQDLFENIACIDSFLSEFRNVTFVLQKSLAHTGYLEVYNAFRVKYLNNDDCSWLVEKRNEVLKEKPFGLEKSLKLTLYHPNGAGVFSTDYYTINDEQDYSSLIEMVKEVVEKRPAIEAFFSVEFVYKEIGSDLNLFNTIDNGIDSMFALLEGLNIEIGEPPSSTRKIVQEKINNLHFHFIPKEAWFVDDYVFYRKDKIFEKGERFEIKSPFKTAVPCSILCEMMGIKESGCFIDDTFDAFIKMQIYAFSKQKELAPTFFILNEAGILSMVMYHATIKTTTYRKIQEMAEEIKKGVPIVAVFHASEMLLYNNPEAFNQDYLHRSKSNHLELLSFNIVTKDGANQYFISSEAILEGKNDCVFPLLTSVETDNTISYLNPLVEAFRNIHGTS